MERKSDGVNDSLGHFWSKRHRVLESGTSSCENFAIVDDSSSDDSVEFLQSINPGTSVQLGQLESSSDLDIIDRVNDNLDRTENSASYPEILTPTIVSISSESLSPLLSPTNGDIPSLDSDNSRSPSSVIQTLRPIIRTDNQRWDSDSDDSEASAHSSLLSESLSTGFSSWSNSSTQTFNISSLNSSSTELQDYSVYSVDMSTSSSDVDSGQAVPPVHTPPNSLLDSLLRPVSPTMINHEDMSPLHDAGAGADDNLVAQETDASGNAEVNARDVPSASTSGWRCTLPDVTVVDDQVMPDQSSAHPQSLNPDAASFRSLNPDSASFRSLNLDAASSRFLNPDAASSRSLNLDAASSRFLNPDAASSRSLNLDAASSRSLNLDAASARFLNLDAASSRSLNLDAASSRSLNPDAASSRSSDDFDFPKRPSPLRYRPDDEALSCSICFDAWTDTGAHRLVSLKCGHCFGQSCIVKWIAGRGGKCPNCNAKATKRDLRVLYVKSLVALDTGERDQALQMLQQEQERRKKAELEQSKMKLNLQLALAEVDQLRSLYSSSSSQTSSQSSTESSMVPSGQGLYRLDKVIKLDDAGSNRVMAFSQQLGQIVVSQLSSNPLFRGYGIRKVNCESMKPGQFLPIHQKMIRDLAFNDDNPDGLMLSVSMDKKVKVTSLYSNTTVISYECENPLWSCTWNMDNATQFFVGQQNGTVLLFDTRNTSQSVMLLNAELSRSPVVSLCNFGRKVGSQCSPGCLIVAQLNMCSLYRSNVENSEYKYFPLPLEGNVINFSIEENSRRGFVSFRPSPTRRFCHHQMLSFKSNETEIVGNPDVTCQVLHSVNGSATCKVLTRSCLLPVITQEGSYQACVGNESAQAVDLYDMSSGQRTQRIPCKSAILDVCSIYIGDAAYFAALNDSSLRLHRWYIHC